MSGHSKWANIKHRKEANDKVRGTVFSKLSRLITLSVIEGGGVSDPALNYKLRLMIEKAKQENMPKDNIQRAIEKGSGPDKALLQEIVYEGFAPYGVAMMIVATTDNHNRTNSEIRSVLERNGGKLCSQGAVSFMFQKCGHFTALKKDISEEQILNLVDQIEAYDVDQDDNEFFVFFPFNQIGKTHTLFSSFHISSPDIVFKPKTFIQVKKASEANSILKLAETLEALEDVQRVFTNMEILTEHV